MNLWYLHSSLDKEKIILKKLNFKKLQQRNTTHFYTSCTFVATEIFFQRICFLSTDLASILRDAWQL